MDDLAIKSCSREEFAELVDKFFTKEMEVTNQNLIAVAKVTVVASLVILG